MTHFIWHDKKRYKDLNFLEVNSKFNANSIFGLYSMDQNSVFNKNKIVNFFKGLGTLQQTAAILEKLIWRNNSIL